MDEQITPDDIFGMLGENKETKDKKIVLAPQSKVNSPELAPYVSRILKIIGIKGAWLSDESMLWDFLLDDERLPELANELGISSLDQGDLICEIAERMKENDA